MVKSKGLSPSPWGVPTLLVKGAFISALFILVLMCDRYFSMLGFILSSVIKESTFLKVLRSVIGLKLFDGPLGLSGFDMAIRTPELMSSSSWFVNVMFNMFAIVWSRRGAEYFSSSGYIWSSPGALLFLSRLRFFLIPACVIVCLNGFGFPIKDGISGVLISLNLFSKWFATVFRTSFGFVISLPSLSSTLGFSIFFSVQGFDCRNLTSSVCELLIASACLFSSSFLSCVTFFFLIWCSTSFLSFFNSIFLLILNNMADTC